MTISSIQKLEKLDTFMDLRVLLDERRRFNLRSELSLVKARPAVSFVKRWSKELNDPYIRKGSYLSLVNT